MNTRDGLRRLVRQSAGIALLITGLGLAGCGARTQAWSQPESPKENKVEWVVYDHSVTFAAGERSLSAEESRQLGSFIREVSYTYGDQVSVRARTGARSVRARAVAAYLKRRNIAAEIIETPKLNRRNGPVLVELGRYVVTSPRCPDWSKPAGADQFNTASSNWGCATTTNLGLMVANPGDLVHGRDGGPQDGEYAGFHIDRYRSGKAPKVSNGGPSGVISVK